MTAPTLAAFIEACVAEDEAVARAATSGPWTEVTIYPNRGEVHVTSGRGDDEDWSLARTDTHVDAGFIARNDPAQVLRTCAAVRAVLAIHESVPTQRPGTEDFQHDYMDVCRSCDFQPYPCPTLTALAAMYAGRDGYGEAVGGEV